LINIFKIYLEFSGSLCGNGIVEEGEECDCGYGTDCKESCCIDASQDTNKCKLKPGKQCSPSQGPCCDNSCSFSSNKTVCMQSNECLNNVRCTGKNATCPRFNLKYFKPDKTECNSGTQVCKAGVRNFYFILLMNKKIKNFNLISFQICSGSICEKYEMEQCFLEGDLKDKKQDKAILCHLACIGGKI
jgi:disintegrin and metalloproteinase domain-containing protein 10